MDDNEIKEPRGINELADLPYSEMTDEEIEIMIEWRTANALRDEEHKLKMEAIHSYFQEQASIQRKAAENASALLDMLTASAIENYSKAGKNV